MTIKGSLETFSLPELFQIIESGSKSGRLTFKLEPHVSNLNLVVTHQLWFDQGSFVAIINPLKQQFLTSRTINNGWIDLKVLILEKSNCPANKALGTYLAENNLLNKDRIDSLFKAQIEEVVKLFKIDRASFEFEELDSSNKLPSDSASFPWSEMTGQQIKARELSLEAIRGLPPGSRFLAELPGGNCGLQRLVNHCNLQFDAIEKYICNTADGSISLRKIAQKMEVSIDKVQAVASSMILAGLLEEVSVVSSDFGLSASATYNSLPTFLGSGERSTKAKGKSKVSNSLLKNLTNFLKHNF